MAPVSTVLRTCGLILYFVINTVALVKDNQEPWILKLEVLSKDCGENICKYLLNAHGGEFLGHNSWRLTPESGSRGGSCDVIYPNYELREITTLQWTTKIEVIVPEEIGKIYFCLRFSERRNNSFKSKWSHQGDKIFLEPKHDGVAAIKDESQTTTEREKESLEDTQWIDLSHDIDVNYMSPIRRPTRKDIGDVEVFDDMVNVLEGIVERDRYENDELDRKKREAVNNGEDANPFLGKDVTINVFNEKMMFNKHDNSTKEDTFENFHTDNSVGEELRQEVVKKNNCESIIDQIINKNGSNIQMPEEVNIARTNTNKEAVDSGIDESNRRKSLTMNEVSGSSFHDKNDELNKLIDKYNQSIVLTEFDYKKPMLYEESVGSEIISREINSKLRNHENKSILDENKGINKDIDAYELEIDAKKQRYKRNTDKLNFHKSDLMNDGELLKNQSRPRNHSDVTTPKAIAKPEDVPMAINIDGIRIENSEKEPKFIGDGIPSVLADSRVTLRLFGDGLTSRTVIAFTNYPPHDGGPGQPCKFLLKGEYMTNPDSLTGKTALFDIIAPATESGMKLYLCVKNLRPDTDLSKDEDKYIHQGAEPFKVFATHDKLMPLWVALVLILICLTFSALFSGLNLGLMSLDRTELKIISNTGTEQERKYARAIMPVRDHGNYLLCSILLGNVAVNSTFTILLDELTSGLFAVIFSTLAIVLLGEITPQAICSRHGLMVGAKSIMVTKAVMALTAPLAFPISKLLDYFLGEEIGSVYNRERLKELVKVTTDVNDLDRDEVNIISGALELRKKTVSDVMTKLEDVFMLPISSVLDFETMSEIIKSGYSRIPVYENSRGNILTVLFIKDLAFVDPDDNTPLKTLCQYYQNPCNFVFEDVTLDVMFKQFKDGHKGHMAFVHRINNEGEGDPFYETIGLVTLEDVIEEMIQAEIVDETDVFMDNRTKRRRNRPQHKLQDFAAFAERHENQRIHISPQLTLATFQFLSTSVDAFRPDTVSETVLRRLLKQDVIQYIKLKGKTKRDPSTYVFQQSKPVDYFVLILEGRVEVTVGRENLVFEAGPFTYFGVQALTQNIGVAESPTPSAMGSLQNINVDSMLRHTFVPDYSVRAITELYYLTVKRSLYLAAKRASLMEKGALSKGTTEQFDTEVDKLLQSVDEDMSISGEHKTPSRQVSPNPVPVSASPITRASFASRTSPEPRNGDLYSGARADEQEKLLK